MPEHKIRTLLLLLILPVISFTQKPSEGEAVSRSSPKTEMLFADAKSLSINTLPQKLAHKNSQSHSSRNILLIGGSLLIVCLVIGGNRILKQETKDKRPKIMSVYPDNSKKGMNVIVSLGADASAARLYLTSMDGEKQFVSKVQHGLQQVDVSHFDEGTYLISLEDAFGTSELQKIIVQG